MQDAFIILSGFALVRFTCVGPTMLHTHAMRVATVIMGIFSMGILGYSLVFGVLYGIQWQASYTTQYRSVN